MNGKMKEMMMQKLIVKDEATKNLFGRRGGVVALPQRLIKWSIAAMAVAAPATSFAASAPGENIAIALSTETVSSPVGKNSSAPIASGAVIDFLVAVTGPTQSGSPATSFAVIDMIPEHMILYVGDLAETGTGPATFVDNDSGLDFSFHGLGSATDSIEFSSDGGKTFDYVPVADTDGFDQNVTHIKLRPHGALLPVSSRHERFSLRYRMKVK